MRRCRRLLELFGVFFKIGLFTFGGGYAMISLIGHEIGERRRWISPDELTEVFAIAESTPGPIAVNCATYVGYRREGVAGGVWATLGVVMPSFIIIYAISLFFERFMALSVVANAFRGIQVAVAFLILRAGLRLAVRLPRRGFELGVCVAAALLVLAINALGWRFSTVWLILCGGVAGLLFRRGAKGEGGASQ
ncbi:MAG: chromate transporter [Clostridia bacterium]|nr:chromate transporter [Clostridia bacterium]